MLFVSLTPFIDKIEQTQAETIKVLQDIKQKNITQEDLDEVFTLFDLYYPFIVSFQHYFNHGIHLKSMLFLFTYLGPRSFGKNAQNVLEFQQLLARSDE